MWPTDGSAGATGVGVLFLSQSIELQCGIIVMFFYADVPVHLT